MCLKSKNKGKKKSSGLPDMRDHLEKSTTEACGSSVVLSPGCQV